MEKTLEQKTSRLLDKNGSTNVRYRNFHTEPITSNFFLLTSLSSWSYLLAIYVATYICSWLLFAIFYYVVGNNFQNSSKPCIENIDGFLSVVLFSIETQHTIGYGKRRPTTKCLPTILILVIQSIMALFIQNITAQAVYMKFSRPNSILPNTRLFEKRCYIIRRNEDVYLCIRIVHGDRQEIIHSNIRLFCYKSRTTKEGEFLPFECYRLPTLSKYDSIPVFLPIGLPILHLIDKASPLYENIQRFDNEGTLGSFEIIITLDGVFRVTGYPCHFRTSYKPHEINIVNENYQNCIFDNEKGEEVQTETDSLLRK